MIARIAKFDNLPDDVDPQAVALLRETVRTAPGYVAGYHLHAPETGKAMSVVVVEDGQALQEIGRRLAAREPGERVGIDPDVVEILVAEPF